MRDPFGEPLRERLLIGSGIALLVAIAGALIWLAYAMTSEPGTPRTYLSSKVARVDLVEVGHGDGGTPPSVLVSVRLPNGRQQAFMVPTQDAARCRVGS